MNVNPWECYKKGYVKNVDIPEEQIQQNGIDLRIACDVELNNLESFNVDFIEQIDCTDNVFATPVATRSSFSRKGIFCTSGVWDTGYNGPGGCTIYNFSGKTIKLTKGTRICQIIFFKAPKNSSKYNGHYNSTMDISSKIEDI